MFSNNQLNIIFKYLVRCYLNMDDCLNILSVVKPRDYCVAALLGIDLSYSNNYALRHASRIENFSLIRYLIENGINIHSNNDIALRYSCQKRNFFIIRFLIENGANIHTGDDWPLRYMVENKNLYIAKYLIENGADIQVNDNVCLRHASYKGDLSIVQFLVENELIFTLTLSDMHVKMDIFLLYSI